MQYNILQNKKHYKYELNKGYLLDKELFRGSLEGVEYDMTKHEI